MRKSQFTDAQSAFSTHSQKPALDVLNASTG